MTGRAGVSVFVVISDTSLFKNHGRHGMTRIRHRTYRHARPDRTTRSDNKCRKNVTRTRDESVTARSSLRHALWRATHVLTGGEHAAAGDRSPLGAEKVDDPRGGFREVRADVLLSGEVEPRG